MLSKAKSLLFLLLVAACSLRVSDASKKCSSGTLYACPNCGGIEVEDCFDCDGFVSTDTGHELCFDRKLFSKHNTDDEDHENHYHYLWNDLVGAVVWFVMAGVATACGVGGGGIYVPLGILLFQFSPKQASGLSQASIFGASLGGLFLNSRNRHPCEKMRSSPGVKDTENEDSDRVVHDSNNATDEETYLSTGQKFYTRPLINYDMALFLAPMEMAGAVLGVLVQKILPNWLYLTIAGCVLSFTAYKTYNKFLAARKKEKAAEAAEAAENGEKTAEEAAIANSVSMGKGETVDGNVSMVKDDDDDETDMSAEDLKLRQQYLEEDMRQYPREKIISLIILWIGLFVLTLLKGGKGVDSLVGITCESVWFGVLIAAQFLWMLGYAVVYGFILMRKQAARVAVRYAYQQDDPIWDFKSLRFYGTFTFVAGIVAGLIGIGGGMVLGPLMLIMGIHPRVSSATTATMIVLTSSSVAVIFVTSGLVPWTYAVFYFGVCFSGAVVGKSKIDGYVKRTGRASLLIFILASIIAFATIGCFVIMFTRLAEKDWCLDGFNEFCKVDSEDKCPADRVLQSIFPNTV